MLSLTTYAHENRVEVYARGCLTREDFFTVRPRLAATGECHPGQRLNVYVEVEGLQGWEPDALSDGDLVDLARRPQLGRMAIVGDERLTQAAMAMIEIGFPAEIRFFSRAEAAEARRWLLGQPSWPGMRVKHSRPVRSSRIRHSQRPRSVPRTMPASRLHQVLLRDNP